MIRKKLVSQVVLAASLSLVALPLATQAVVKNEQIKPFSVSGSSISGTAKSNINDVGTVYTSVVTEFTGSHSKITSTNTSAIDGNKTAPTSSSAGSTSNKAVNQQNLGTTNGGSIYEVWGSHSVYVGGVYKGGTTTYTKW